MNRFLFLVAALTSAATSASSDFEVLFSANGHIRSFAYFRQGPDNLIDTVIRLENELLRYKTSYLVFQFENETDMGEGSQPGMPFDPNRGRWLFALGARTELGRQFFEVTLRHDCYHGIDRWLPGEDYKMTSAVVGFGSRGYLQKYRYRDAAASDGALRFPARVEYYLAPSLYVPRAGFWQRSPYLGRLEANARFDAVQWKRLGLGVELANVLYYAASVDVQRSHRLSLQTFLYGESNALIVFFSWWPYDDQLLRNRAHRTVGGLELSF